MIPAVVIRLFSTEALLLDVFAVEWAHKNVVEFEPLLRLVKVKLFLFFNEAVIMATICSTAVNYNADQFKVVIVLREIEHNFAAFCSFLEVLLCVLAHVELEGEFEVVIYLDSNHVVKIKFESL
jgi:hypothetical protein